MKNWRQFVNWWMSIWLVNHWYRISSPPNFRLSIIMYQSIPKPPILPPGHLTRVKLRAVGNLTQNEARPVGHLTFVSKRLSAVGSKRISQFFDTAGEPRSRVIALVDSTWVFLLSSFYIVLSWNIPSVERRQAEQKIRSGWKFCRTCFHSCVDMPGGWGIWPSLKL